MSLSQIFLFISSIFLLLLSPHSAKVTLSIPKNSPPPTTPTPLTVLQSYSDSQFNNCQLKLLQITSKIMAGDLINTTQDEKFVALFSGKSILDLGSKQLCDLFPSVHYLVADTTLIKSAFIGICVFQECTADIINTVQHQVFDLIFALTKDPSIYNVQLTIHDKESTIQMRESQNAGFVAVVIIIGFLAFLGIGGIIVQYTNGFDLDHADLERKEVPFRLAERNDRQLLQSKNKCGLCLLSFSVTRNFTKLMSTKGGGQGYDDNLQVFAGVRTFSMMYVILGHINGILIYGINIADVQQIMKGFYVAFVQGAFYSVDAFFCLAGFLGTYVLLGKLKKSNGCINIPLAYFHRWYRLAPALAFCILTGMYLFPFIISGPIAYMYQKAVIQSCRSYWWSNLIFLNNFIPWKMDDQCVGWTWYLANDFQFFLITPFILMIMHRSKLWGFIVNVSLILLSGLSGILITYYNNFRAPSLEQNFTTQYYQKPYNRMASYMVGVLLAQLYYDRKMAKNGDEQAEHTCGNKIFRLYEKSRLFSWASALLGFFLVLFLIFIYYTALSQEYGQWSLGVSMIYNGFSRPLFVFGMLIVLFPTFEGKLPWLKIFMANPLFKVIGKLTYCAYLMHYLILYAYALSIQSTNYYSKVFIFGHFFGFYSISYLTAMLVSLLLQSPILTLEKTILFPPKKNKKKILLQDKDVSNNKAVSDNEILFVSNAQVKKKQ